MGTDAVVGMQGSQVESMLTHHRMQGVEQDD
jgi:hypothetical protein